MDINKLGIRPLVTSVKVQDAFPFPDLDQTCILKKASGAQNAFGACCKNIKTAFRSLLDRAGNLRLGALLWMAGAVSSPNLLQAQKTIASNIDNNQAQAITVHIDGTKGRIAVSPTMWGIFFEDINFAADGGIYAELIKNRSFEFDNPEMGWRILNNKNNPPGVEFDGKMLITNRGQQLPHTGNHRYAHITLSHYFGLENEGFRGIGFIKGEPYRFSTDIRVKNGSQLALQLLAVDSTGGVQFQSSFKPLTTNADKWTTFETVFTADKTLAKGRLIILIKGAGELDMDMLSLFPVHTWKNRPGGLRADLVQKLYDLHPGFIRFPGGCIVEGRTLVNRYQWKNTVGPVAERTTITNRWQTEFKPPRNAPDYFQSYGLGFYEYFQLAEDLGAQPLPILNCGMACQYNSGEVAADLEPYIQDALDLIEFANADTTTPYGRLRAQMGHPQPFHLKYLGVGNEQWESQYFDRYKIFENRLKLAHPEIQLVSGSGPYNSGRWFEDAWSVLRTLHPSLVDEHYYAPPEWLLNNAGRYDHYDRKGPKVFAGEYAAHGKSTAAAESANSFYSALTEAAFMTGLERNADVVRMASYAPLLANINAWQWRPDLIWFDNLHSIATPNYYVQQIFSLAKGTDVLTTSANNQPLKGQDSLYASTTIDRMQHKLYIKLINVSSHHQPVHFSLADLQLPKTAKGRWTLLTADSAYAYNSLINPTQVQPQYLEFGGKAIRKNRMSASGYPLPVIQKTTGGQKETGSSSIAFMAPASSVNMLELDLQ